MPKLERRGVIVVLVVGKVGVDQPEPVAAALRLGKCEEDDIVMRVGDKQQRRLAAASANPAGLSAPVEQKTEAASSRILPVLRRSVDFCMSSIAINSAAISRWSLCRPSGIPS